MKISPRLTLNNGVMIDQLGFGLYKVPPADAAGLVTMALEAGYRPFDTAAMYGNETGVGKASARRLRAARRGGGSGEARPSLPREDLFVTTKVWNDDQGYDTTLRAFETSMANLGLDYVDLYLIHWPCAGADSYRNVPGTGDALPRRQVRAIGVSNFQPDHLDRLLETGEVVPAVNQIEPHPWLQQAELRTFTPAWHPHRGLEPAGPGQVLQIPWFSNSPPARPDPAQVILRWHVQLGNIAIPKASS